MRTPALRARLKPRHHLLHPPVGAAARLQVESSRLPPDASTAVPLGRGAAVPRPVQLALEEGVHNVALWPCEQRQTTQRQDGRGRVGLILGAALPLRCGRALRVRRRGRAEREQQADRPRLEVVVRIAMHRSWVEVQIEPLETSERGDGLLARRRL
eukprot:scaffold30129_cov35-Phaeocystis_antarctica.AAC.1